MDCFGKFEPDEEEMNYVSKLRENITRKVTQRVTQQVTQQDMRKFFKMAMSIGLSKDRAIEELAKSYDLTTEEVEEYLGDLI